jgi:hypothetical protein
MNVAAWQHIIFRDFTNLSLLRPRNRRLHGHLITMHQSGTHWLKHMLTMLLVDQYKLPMPQHIGDDSIVGSAKRRPIHRHIPQIIHSHALPSPLVHIPPFGRLLRYPRYILLLRDMRAALVSRYEKHKVDFPDCAFSDFLRGDPRNRRFDKDIWWELRFLNAWHRIDGWMPGQVRVIHYEHLLQDTRQNLRAVCEHLQLGDLDDQALDRAIAASAKDTMAQRENPDKPHKVVRQSRRDPVEWFSDEDRRFFQQVTDRGLCESFGYDYHDWSSASRGPTRNCSQTR